MVGAAGSGEGSALADDGLQFNERKLGKDLAMEKTRANVNDVFLNEAVSILSDSVALKDGKSPMAASDLSSRPVVVTALPAGTSGH
jgi:carboxyl-terminal processing protease